MKPATLQRLVLECSKPPDVRPELTRDELLQLLQEREALLEVLADIAENAESIRATLEAVDE